eukprot:TRINITY_DN4995_c0_g2_i1.p1 TRINITY_DN4995_c0_g2~~TRINITY_DN4995_c0_g2_i1.p1  ORF type:complete len:260 (+),score=64.65 TRINITY_DN4995_c0_g2_i1:238-1017(+)
MLMSGCPGSIDAVMYGEAMTVLLPVVLSGCRLGAAQTVSGIETCLVKQMAPQYMPPHIAHSLLQSAIKAFESSSWSMRRAALVFVQALVPTQVYVLEASHQQSVVQALTALLVHSHLDTALLANKVLTSLTSILMNEEQISKLIKKLQKQAATKLPPKPKKGEDDSKYSEVLLQKRGALLGLAALVSSQPYSVPAWMPAVLHRLTRHLSEPAPIPTLLQPVFREFKRTHQDRWDEFKTLFSEEQLDALREVEDTPSYIA